MPPGQWITSGLLTMGVMSRTCLTNLPGYSGHMAEPTKLSSFSWEEKWLDILGFSNFTAVHFVTKCHSMNSSQNTISAIDT